MYTFQARRLSKSFRDRTAVDGVSLSAEPGEVLGLVGPNGAGKTTLMLMLIGLLPPDQGEVWHFGKSITKGLNQIGTSSVGWVPQELAFYSGMSVEENLNFFGQLYRLPGGESRRRTAELLESCRLTECRDQISGTLSGGMQRRLNLALGLVHSPRLLVLDEPTVGIDTDSRGLILDYLKGLARAGTTVVLSSHDPQEIARMCHRVVRLDQGRLASHEAASGLSPAASSRRKPERASLGTHGAAAPRRQHKDRGAWLVALAILAGLLALRLVFFEDARRPSLAVSPTSFSGRSENSPDGQKLAFLKDGAIWIRTLDQEAPIRLGSTEGALPGFFWSPDSGYLAFARHGQLWTVTVSAHQAHLECDLPETTFGGGVWGTNDQIVFKTNHGFFYQVEAQGGKPLLLLSPAS